MLPCFCSSVLVYCCQLIAGRDHDDSDVQRMTTRPRGTELTLSTLSGSTPSQPLDLAALIRPSMTFCTFALHESE